MRRFARHFLRPSVAVDETEEEIAFPRLNHSPTAKVKG